MGLLDHHRETVRQRVHDEWESQLAPVREMAEFAHGWTGVPVPTDDGVIGRPGESAYLVLHGADLIEPRRLPGHWAGSSHGISVPIYKGIRYRVGATRGTYQQGEEVPTPIDQGTVLISDQRVVFAGSKQTREWLYPKLIGFHHDEKLPWTALQVSNRQKVSGILYTQDTATLVRFRLELALAQFKDTRAAFAASIDQQLAKLLSQEPPQPGTDRPATGQPRPPAPPELPPAGWYPNPEGGSGQRFWDGTTWSTDTRG